ncbi:MAG: 2-oxo acid dehydrogenase subunit E2 [Treponema sp.]|jgi:pyruvate dehydrogenase E2 component (dihydrolipoamide acetyltransferase)|nr:2-oxo acid dehydrogenase subunit E2 [Treponema sp.]
MAHILIMPRQGNTVESCIIGEWKVKEGDTVSADTPVCVVETDKATFEVPAGAAGTVLKIFHPAGDDVPVLQSIMAIGKPGEELPAGEQPSAVLSAEMPLPDTPSAPGTLSPDTPPFIPAAVPVPGAAPSVGLSAAGDGRAASPRAKNLAREEAVDLRSLGGSGPGGRIIAADVAAAAAGRPPLTEAARDEIRRRIAAGLPAGVAGPGSGIGGRITLANTGGAPAVSSAAGEVPVVPSGDYTDAPIKGIRKIIAGQMMDSHNTTAAFTLNTAAPVLRLQELRARFKASDPSLGLSTITVNDLVLFAVSRVLPDYPYMNAHKLNGVVRTFKPVHLGCAVATPRGLMVPVIRNADKLRLIQISQKARELAEACRNGTVSPDDLRGSTFTVTNLGNTGVESFTPIINIPEVSILGVCGIQPKPAEVSPGSYEILPHLGLSLTIDHAVVDGAPAAEFLKAVHAAIRDIDMWIAK